MLQQRIFLNWLTIGLPVAGLLLAADAFGANDLSRVTINGAYLGLLNSISQEGDSETDEKRTQFDYAANLDFSIRLDDEITGFVQLQGGPGGGSLGLIGPGAEVTDVFLRYSHPKHPIAVTFGSFDTPLGYEAPYQNNNGEAVNHPLIINSLYYSGFAEGPLGTLNSLGIKAEYSPELFDLTMAVTNGTAQTADNADGNFELVLGGGFRPVKGKNLRFGGAYMLSNDRETSGATGKASEFSAWLLESHFVSAEGLTVRAFISGMTFDDDIQATDDDVMSMTAELGYASDSWHLAGRFSSWIPEDDNGSGDGIASAIPNPGLAVTQSGQIVFVDQKVNRIQIGGGYKLFESVSLKAEYFLDDYDQTSDGVSTDVNGLIIALAGVF